MRKEASAADSRLKSHLSPSTANSWLTTFSKCGLEQQAQLCIEYIIKQDLQVDIDLLRSLQTTHAAQLLEAREKERCVAKRKVVDIVGYLGSTFGYLAACECRSCYARWISVESINVTCCGEDPLRRYL